MAQQQARDEAGNIWNIDEAGNPVSLASAAGAQGGGAVIAPNPVQAQRQSVDLAGAGLGNQKTAQQIALEAARAPSEIQKATLEVESTRLANEKARRELANPVETKQAQTDRFSRLMQLANQVGRTQTLYNTGIGTTKGIAGVQDYLPTDANSRFDVAGAALSQQGLAAFKVPGTGTVSDRDAMMFDRASLPTASTRDAAVEEQLRGIRSRVDEELKALGRAPLDWASIERQQNDQKQNPSAIIPGAPTVGGGGTSGGGSGPAGYDVATTSGINGGGGGGNFTNAAGIAMAQKMKAVYNRGGGVAEINRLLQDNGFQPLSDAASISAIQKRGPINFAPPQVDDTRGAAGRALGSVADSPFGAYAINSADALTGNNLDSLAGGSAGLAIDYANQRNPTASMLGTIAGSTIAAGGAEVGLGAAAARAGMGASPWVARGADALYGAVSGAGSADGEGDSRLLGAAVGGVAGLGGGMAGRAAARGAGNLLTGVRNADVQGLRAAGVPLTAGQAVSQSGVLGQGVQALENATTGVPLVGAVTRGRYTEGFEGLNRAAFDEGLAPINANTGGVVREQGIDLARQARSQGYSDALDPVNLNLDAPYDAEMIAAQAAGQRLPQDMADRSRFALDRVAENADPNGNLTGRGFQQGIRRLRRVTSQNAPLPNGDDLGDVMRQGEDALVGLLQRQSPQTLPAYNAANTANRNVEILRDAVNRARSGTTTGDPGLFSVSQLSDAAAASSKKFGNSQGTTNQPFYNLTRAAQRVLPSKVGDSGTATRAAVTAGLLGTGGAGGYAVGGEGGTGGLGSGTAGAVTLAGILAAGGTRTGQRLLTSALLDRPEMAIRAGRAIQNRARIGGIFGAPLLAGTVPLLSQ